jgi:toxin-antitoxin system PIN domain toxin
MYLPDINVWLALAFEAHKHHGPAKNWFEGIQDDSIAFCRLTQLGFLRLSTNSAVFAEEALSLGNAWDCYDLLLEDSRVEFVLEPLGLDHFFRLFTAGSSWSPKVWNDAYLAAFSLTANVRLVSFDRAFRRYEDLDCSILADDRNT